MPRIALLIILATLAAVISCGQSLTVEEYAELCGEIVEDLDDVNYLVGIDVSDVYRYNEADDLQDMGEDLDEMRDLIVQYKSLSPPPDLEEFHEAQVAWLDVIDKELLSLVKDALSVADDLLEASDDEDYDKAEDLADELQDLDDEYDDIYYEDEFEDLLEDARDAWDDLRSRDRRELEREGCR